MTIESQKYSQIPNNSVQNIISNELNKPSFIQLYGKRSIVYFKQLIELQNIREEIHFSIDMIIWMMGLKKSPNIKREKNYFKDFLLNIHKNSLITFSNDINFQELSFSEFLIAKLNIYNYKEKKDGGKQKINYFELLDSEYNKIMNEYSGELDKYNLLNLFCNIKSRIKRNDKDVLPSNRQPEVAYPSYKLIMEDIFLESEKTLRKYIDELVKLNLICFDYAGDMIMKNEGQKPIRRKANFTYALFKPECEIELENAISLFRSQKRALGWSFLSKDKEILADEKRSITQKINMLEKLSKDKTLSQSQKKELRLLKRKQEKWKREYDEGVDTREIEENKLKSENPDKTLSEIYEDMGFDAKAERAYEEEEEEEENDQQYEDDQMNPDDIMSDIIDTINDDEIFEDIPESLKLTKQFQDELKKIDINDIWDDELESEIKAKKCIVCGKEYTEITNRKNYCQNCIDKQEILDKSARRYRDNQEYDCDYADEF